MTGVRQSARRDFATANLSAALPKAKLKVDHAVLFTLDAGDYKGEIVLVVDANGKAGCQADKDFVIVLHGADNMDHFTLKNINT